MEWEGESTGLVVGIGTLFSLMYLICGSQCETYLAYLYH